MHTNIKYFLLLFAFALSVTSTLKAQEETVADTTIAIKRFGLFPDTKFWRWTERNFSGGQAAADRPFDYTVVVSPYYTSTNSFTLVGGLMGEYSWDRSDSLLQKSQINVIGQASVTGMVSAEIRGANFTRHDRFRWNYQLRWQRQPIDIWGIGFFSGRDSTAENVNRNTIFLKADASVRVVGRLFAGIGLNFNYTNASNLINKYKINNQADEVWSFGFGPLLQFDSRDNTAVPTRGIFVRYEQLFYPRMINMTPFSSSDLTISGYRRLWKGAVGCFELHGRFNYGGQVPWTMMAQVAETAGRMRGYYEGRYRDRNMMEGQVELRQHIWKQWGFAVFGGAANVFDYFDNICISQTLPNFGFGIRYAFKNSNIRIDMGFTKNKPGVEFSINEAF